LQRRKAEPVVSVDTKKKELVGNYKNAGSDYRPQGQPARVNVHDFADNELGRAVPYGVYDVAATPVLPHHAELAWPPAHRSRCGRRTDRRHHHRDGSQGRMPARPAQLRERHQVSDAEMAALDIVGELHHQAETPADDVAIIVERVLSVAAQASAAWEAAVCWDDEYAIKRLAEVRAV
jgi:hypothetical protein